MATIAIMLGGALLNAAAFIGGNYLAKSLSGDSGNAALAEKKRHDLALEKFQMDYAKYQKDRTQLLDWIAVYYYKPSPQQKNGELLFIGASTLALGYAAFRFL